LLAGGATQGKPPFVCDPRGLREATPASRRVV
jgi:hypothetical protein